MLFHYESLSLSSDSIRYSGRFSTQEQAGTVCRRSVTFRSRTSAAARPIAEQRQYIVARPQLERVLRQLSTGANCLAHLCLIGVAARACREVFLTAAPTRASTARHQPRPPAYSRQCRGANRDGSLQGLKKTCPMWSTGTIAAGLPGERFPTPEIGQTHALDFHRRARVSSWTTSPRARPSAYVLHAARSGWNMR